VSASISRTFCEQWIWRADARFVATVVFPDAALRVEDREHGRAPRPVAHLHRAALDHRPEPSSTVIDRMHIASTRQRIESAVCTAGWKNSSALSGLNIRSSALALITISAGMLRERSWSRA
jgi:hypothetical protein